MSTTPESTEISAPLGPCTKWRDARLLHEAQYPEKPLDEVRSAFLQPDNLDDTPPDPDLLDAAIERYTDIQRRGRFHYVRTDKQIRTALCRHAQPPDGSTPLPDFESENEFFALLREHCKRVYGIFLYNTQIIAMLLMIDAVKSQQNRGEKQRFYEQVRTGEGKSIMIALQAAYWGVKGRKVDVITSNQNLALRDAEKYKPIFNLLGLSLSWYAFHKNEYAAQHPPNILYTTNNDLCFQWLRSEQYQCDFFGDGRCDMALVDEGDNSCMDLAGEECLLCDHGSVDFFTRSQLLALLHFADKERDLCLNDPLRAIALFMRQNPETAAILPVYIGIFLDSACQSATMREGVDYIVENGRTTIVDVRNTGLLKSRHIWGNGLDAFIALRRNLQKKGNPALLGRMPNIKILEMYDCLCSFSGTFGSDIDYSELQRNIGMDGISVPPHHASQRNDEPLFLTNTVEGWKSAILQRVEHIMGEQWQRAILIIIETIRDSQIIMNLLEEHNIAFQVHNGVDVRDTSGEVADEASIIEHAGKAGVVTVSTNLFGRGTDIQIDEECHNAGGLDVCMGFIARTKRVEMQARGRSGRQGAPGSSRVIACADNDMFLTSLPPALQQAIVAMCNLAEVESAVLPAVVNMIRNAYLILESRRRIAFTKLREVMKKAQDLYFWYASKHRTEVSHRFYGHHQLDTYVFEKCFNEGLIPVADDDSAIDRTSLQLILETFDEARTTWPAELRAFIEIIATQFEKEVRTLEKRIAALDVDGVKHAMHIFEDRVYEYYAQYEELHVG